ncbi:MAG: flavin reductase [Campylobacterales bacterium]|nr:flavin reductase [Campylobacterales bacterium]
MFDVYTSLEKSNHSQPRVTALMACQNNLMAASWHMPISKSPFRYAVAVREENYTHTLLKEHGAFSLNFLPFEYLDIVDMTGRIHGNTVNKLAKSGLETEGNDEHGNVLLKASDFIYTCKICDTYSNGDHTIFIADVTKIYVNENQSNKPILFTGRGRYTTSSQVTIVKQVL